MSEQCRYDEHSLRVTHELGPVVTGSRVRGGFAILQPETAKRRSRPTEDVLE